VSREGHRDVFDVRASKFQQFKKKGVTKAVFVMRDTDNNRITSFLGRGRRSQMLKFEKARSYANENQSLRVEGDVVSHKKYRGELETVVKNIVVVDRLEAPIKPSANKGKIRLLEENKSRVRSYRDWEETFLGRVRKAVKVRRKLEEHPFSDDALKRLTKTMAVLADVHHTKQEQYKNALDYVQSHPSVYS
jgi:aspartyl/asparaginyl-tRNA synthetase